MTHISPYAATRGLLAAAAAHLAPHGQLFVYGPFSVDGGTHTSEGNAAFDTSLRARNAEWGLRDVEQLRGDAASEGLALDEVVQMPANNLTLVFSRAQAAR
eukprot:354555-Chlamydomonas_euryale.AAC.1